MSVFSAGRFIKYLLFSNHRNGHGIHSPFAFDLVSVVFRNKIDPDIVFSIEKIRNRLHSDLRSITVNDLGAGSDKLKTSHRKVSDIARYSAVPKKYGLLLSNMSKAFGKPIILEFGTSLGISTMYMAASCGNSMVVTMEGCRETSEIAEANFRDARLTNIRLINGSFESILPQVKSEKITPGLVFIDGNHRKEPVLRYFSQVADMSDNNSVVIVDDINYSREMADAWTMIKNHKNVTLSVDVFRMGIVFFRKELNHINYVVSY